MVSWFESIDPIFQALVATCFTWLMTGAGAALVFLFKDIKKKVLDGMLGFAAGVMIAASFWSLLKPSIEMAEEVSSLPAFIPPAIGFLGGGLFLLWFDGLIPKLKIKPPAEIKNGSGDSWHRSVLLIMAITLHNLPEGLAVGVAFGALEHNLPGSTLGSAMALALGIGIQNFPEGTAVSVPLRREGLSTGKSFMFGQFSGIIEPIAGFIGAATVILIRPLLPYALAFAAGAMIFVVVKELVPESQAEKQHTKTASLGALVGFTVMMMLDVALGA